MCKSARVQECERPQVSASATKSDTKCYQVKDPRYPRLAKLVPKYKQGLGSGAGSGGPDFEPRSHAASIRFCQATPNLAEMRSSLVRCLGCFQPQCRAAGSVEPGHSPMCSGRRTGRSPAELDPKS